jgi:hypothetical protein
MDAASYTLSIGNQSLDGSGRRAPVTGAGRVVGDSARLDAFDGAPPQLR